MSNKSTPTQPASHLKVVQYDSHRGNYTFDDGSLWELRLIDFLPVWTCKWQPTTHTVNIDKVALQTLLDIASDWQKKNIDEQGCTASLDYAVDAAKEALGGLEI
jgi:hypothetical protein